MVLTVKGKAEAVVQDAGAYQRLLDIAARADAEEGIRQGLEDSRKGKVRPAREFFEEFEARLELGRRETWSLCGSRSGKCSIRINDLEETNT